MVIHPISVAFQHVPALNRVTTALKDVFLFVLASPATGQILSIKSVFTNVLQATLPLTKLIEYVCFPANPILPSEIETLRFAPIYALKITGQTIPPIYVLMFVLFLLITMRIMLLVAASYTVQKTLWFLLLL